MHVCTRHMAHGTWHTDTPAHRNLLVFLLDSSIQTHNTHTHTHTHNFNKHTPPFSLKYTHTHTQTDTTYFIRNNNNNNNNNKPRHHTGSLVVGRREMGH